jgi:hypothetical protein
MLEKGFDCLVVGDIFLDVFLASRNQSVPFLAGGASYCSSAKIDFGGAGNVAVGLAYLGGKAAFVGKAGDDLWGRLYTEDLNAKGVISRVFNGKAEGTGITLVVLLRNRDRFFYAFRGANDELLAEEIDASTHLLRDSKYLYISGFSLAANPQRNAILHAVKLAKENNIGVFFDPGSYNLITSNSRLFTSLLNDCDVFCPNLDEAKAITKTNSLKATISKFLRMNKLVALKCGAHGCVLIARKNYVKIPPFRVSCIDTTGAGDAFAAALIYGLVNDFPIESIGHLANWFASQKVKNLGSRSFPSKNSITDFLASLPFTEKA